MSRIFKPATPALILPDRRIHRGIGHNGGPRFDTSDRSWGMVQSAMMQVLVAGGGAPIPAPMTITTTGGVTVSASSWGGATNVTLEMYAPGSPAFAANNGLAGGGYASSGMVSLAGLSGLYVLLDTPGGSSPYVSQNTSGGTKLVGVQSSGSINAPITASAGFIGAVKFRGGNGAGSGASAGGGGGAGPSGQGGDASGSTGGAGGGGLAGAGGSGANGNGANYGGGTAAHASADFLGGGIGACILTFS